MANQKPKTRSKIQLNIEPLKSGRLILEKEIDEGITLRDLLNELARTHPDVVELTLDIQSQKLTGATAIILNGSFIDFQNGLETRLHDGDVIDIVPLIVGG